MNKRVFTYIFLLLIVFGTTSAITSNPNADTGRTGAAGVTCVNSCHNSFTLNGGGGNVTVAGLPTTNYVAGTAYPFSLTITHATADRLKWGFAIKAVNAATNAAIGTFTLTNSANKRISSSEVTSATAPTTAASASYTFSGMTWTSPAAATAPANVKFYFVGNAANGNNNTSGDYIYASSTTVALPIKLTSFTTTLEGNNVALFWQVESDLSTNYFEVEKSTDKINFTSIAKINGSNSSIARKYYFTDSKLNSNLNYYRLKMVDKDGTISYSNIQSVTLKTKESYISNVYPNPIKVGQEMNIEIVSNKEQTCSLTLININGKIISSREKNILQGYNNVQLKLGNYVPLGNYYLLVKVGSEISKQMTVSIVE
ncbi:MAG: choice-of-anchor V domain-containing protein [Chitinophagaceae bacterium]